jgi:hypothetical protein
LLLLLLLLALLLALLEVLLVFEGDVVVIAVAVVMI